MNFCPKCGTKKDGNFCTECGFNFLKHNEAKSSNPSNKTDVIFEKVSNRTKPDDSLSKTMNLSNSSEHVATRNNIILGTIHNWEIQYKRPHYFYIYLALVLLIAIINISSGNAEWYIITFGAIVILSPIWLVTTLKYYPRIKKANNIREILKRNPQVSVKASIEYEYRTRMMVKCETVDIHIGQETVNLDYPEQLISADMSAEEFVIFLNKELD